MSTRGIVMMGRVDLSPWVGRFASQTDPIPVSKEEESNQQSGTNSAVLACYICFTR